MAFLPDWPVILQFAAAVILLTIIPGPDMALFVGRAISQGRKAGLACLFGACTGIMIHVFLVALGLSALIITSPAAFFILKCAGSAYLLWLACQAVLNRSAFSLSGDRINPLSLLRNYVTGLTINLLNPKIILFNMTFLPQFVSAHDAHAAGKLLFLGLSFIPISLPITIAMVLAADRFAAVLKGRPGVSRMLDWLMATMFTAFALRLLISQNK